MISHFIKFLSIFQDVFVLFCFFNYINNNFVSILKMCDYNQPLWVWNFQFTGDNSWQMKVIRTCRHICVNVSLCLLARHMFKLDWMFHYHCHCHGQCHSFVMATTIVVAVVVVRWLVGWLSARMSFLQLLIHIPKTRCANIIQSIDQSIDRFSYIQ